MALDATELQSLLDQLKRARYSGQRSVQFADRSITWGSDEELAGKIRALEADIAGTGGTTVYRTSYVSHER